MGGRAGGGAGTLQGDSTYKGRIRNVESLINMKDPAMYKATKEAISNFAAKLGIPERNVKLADLDGNVMGIGAKGSVYLNKKYFNKSAKDFQKVMASNYKSGHMTKTNKPLAHVANHELAHAAWTSDLRTPKAIAAGKEIGRLWKSFTKSGGRGYGSYAGKNIDEFWAEASTKAAHGKADKYSKAVKAIYKKYQL